MPAWMIGSMMFLAVLLHDVPLAHAASAEQQRLVEEATVTFERFLDDPRLASWYRAQGKNIKAVFIVPRFLRGAFLIGAAGGKGVLLAQDFVHGGWSPPAFYGMSVASFGAQAGADSSEVVLIVQTFSAIERFYGSGTVKMGLDAGLTMGTLGEGGTTGLDIVSFTWSKGAFAGMALNGLAITAMDSANEAYYGMPVKPEEILSNGSVKNTGADRLRASVGRLIPQTP